MITTKALAKNSVTSHIYHFFLVVRIFKNYNLSNIQVYNIVNYNDYAAH